MVMAIDSLKVLFRKVLAVLFPLEVTRGLFIILTAWLLQSAIIAGDFGFLLLASMIGRVVVENVRSKRINTLSLDFQEDLRRRLHWNWFNSNLGQRAEGREQSYLPLDPCPLFLNSGELLTLFFDTVETFDEFFIKMLPNLLASIVLLPLILIVTTIADSLTALIFLITLPIAPFLLYLIGNAISKRNQQALSKLNKLNADFKELIAAIATLKIFRQSETAINRLKATSEQSATATLEVLKLAFVSAFVLELITTLSIALVAVTVGLRLVDGSINFDVALFLLILAPEFYSPIRQIGAAFHAVVKAKDSIERIVNREQRIAKRGIANLKSSSLFTPHSSLTVVTGESGSGKSTLLRKLLREHNNEAVARLPQQPHLFKASIRDNVALFKKIDDALILQALNDLAVSNQQTVDSRLENLSRGELQRIGLARVLVTGASTLILDEPTAALDVNTKQLIINKIISLKQTHTLIIATHDPKLISLADNIINLDEFSQT